MYEPSVMESVLRDVAAGKVVPMRQRVLAWEQIARKAPQVELQTFHTFAPGIYIRELHIPAGHIVTGQIHKYECTNILLKGVIQTLVGDELKTIKAPHMQVAAAGMKRIGAAIEAVIWLNIHPNPDDCVDLDVLEKRYVCDTEEEYQAFLTSRERPKWLG